MRNKNGRFVKGIPSWNKGVKRWWNSPTEFKKGEHRSSITEFKKGQMRGNKNINWKGELVGYANLHTWVRRCLGKASYCQNNLLHKSARFHWANVSHEYRRDLKDWMQLCQKCHGKHDKGRNWGSSKRYFENDMRIQI